MADPGEEPGGPGPNKKCLRPGLPYHRVWMTAPHPPIWRSGSTTDVENTIIKYDHITEGLKSLNWLNVNDRLLVNDLLMVHKCIHDLIPSYLTGKFIQRSKIHGRNTRGSGELDLPICRLKTGQRSFAFRGAKLYNNLPNEIKQTSDVKKFKAKVCNYLSNL